MPTTAEKRRVFRALHARGCFVIPNPWDIGTARYLQHLGFPAIATTSSGAAWSLGLPDTAVGRDAMLAHIAAIVAASDLRVKAYAAAGADCLYAPGIRTREHIARIVEAVAPKPVNVLIGGTLGLSVKDLAEIGVRRISVGGALARAAWGGFIRAARAIAEAGTFDALADAVPFAELNGFFRQDLERRRP